MGVPMTMLPSAHVDTFTRDHLPPAEQWPELLFTLPETDYPDRLNCAAELLDTAVATFGADRQCLLTEDLTWTYGDLAGQVDRVARVLTEDLGVLPGNRVMLYGPNTPWLMACWFGVVKAGAVAVTAAPLLRAGELRTVAEIAEVSHAICDPRTTDELTKAQVDGLKIVTYDDLADGPTGAFETAPTSADDVCMIAFTSGTTGRPKGCMHFHRDVLAVADTFGRHILRATADDVFTGTPPLAFTYGLGGLAIFPIRVGASVLMLERAGPDALLEAIERHRVSVLFTAPTAYRAMLPRLAGHDVSSLRRCVSAGESLAPQTWDAWHTTTGVKIIDGIGATELLHIFISAADADIRPGSTGLPVPGWEARIVDATGRDVPDGEPGFLAVRGPVGCRYLADPRQTGYVKDGWNLTGDTYIRDPDGYFWYQARSDDMIISAGYNIAGPEVEAALLRHPAVAETGVVGVPDTERGQIVTAFVILQPNIAPDDQTARELQDFVKRQIAPYKYPRAIRFVTELPRTATGKLQRYRLRDLP